MTSLPKETRQWILTNKPTSLPSLSGPSQTFTLKTNPLPSLQPNQILLKTLYISNDPAQRGWISANADPARLYVPPVPVGAVMAARTIAEILESTSDEHKKGERVIVSAGWSEYAVLDASKVQKIRPLEGIGDTQYLGSLGLTGLTAWYGITEIARAGGDDTVVVSGAAGATGSMVVQIAKHILGCKRVVGIAGGAEKCKWVESLGADECLDYKAGSFKEDLIRATDGFVEVYFDNVGGSMLDLMLTRMKRHGRVAACGAVAEYNKDAAAGEGYGIKNWFEVISNRIEIKGFIIFDFMGKAAETTEKLVKATKEGKIKMDGENETVVEVGFEGVVETWMKLFEGGNRGKLITKLV
ncbi:MAG: hypothetical protein LQ352_002899 [Teloschistes flavicans]|nr:MAG: hypothetical protein LQ352_002899 [Teloschistes flavicans]